MNTITQSLNNLRTLEKETKNAKAVRKLQRKNAQIITEYRRAN